MKIKALAVLIVLFLLALPIRAQINLLHEFAGGAGDGGYPRGDLLLSDSTFYGMTWIGGVSGQGTIFKIQTDGSGFDLLHEFVGGVNDGAQPNGSLILSGTTLYGMTCKGGDSDLGTIFKIETDGNGFALLHEFSGSSIDGAKPLSCGSLIISNSTLYGMTTEGGYSSSGTVFKIETNGSGFALLHSFASSTNNGSQPFGSLILSGTTLFGMTIGGGESASGTIFKIEIDGSDFTLLHEFAGGADDGANPQGALILSGSILYGMTSHGGDNDCGTVFKIKTDGNEFSMLHEFTGGVVDGAYPKGSLLRSGSILYGMTGPDGVYSNLGTIFKLSISGIGYTLLHSFAGGPDDGGFSDQSLIISNSSLFGMTQGGGDSEMGVIFSLLLPPGIAITSPNGGESWTSGNIKNITWTSTGSIANVNIHLSVDNGVSWNPVASGTANDGSYAWTVPSTPSPACLVRVSDTDGDPSDTSDAVFVIAAAPTETVSAPNTPVGPTSGTNNISYTFSTSGAASSLGHAVQYRFDWGDGSDSLWWVEGITQVSHSWAAAGTYHVRAQARCAVHNGIESLWSEPQTIIIYEDSASGMYNSPSQYKVLPEVIWAQAAGSGNWISEVQVTDITGGSQVRVYYNTATARRGPFLLWDNSTGLSLRSKKFANLLEVIDGLDSGEFTYYGTVGAVEFITQDGNHKIHAAARTANGNFAKTFSALSLHDDNTATLSRSMIIPNLVNNADYRSTCGFFNPSSNESVTVEMKLLTDGDVQVGNTISRALASYGFMVLNPFTEAGVPYPGTASDNLVLEVTTNAATHAKVMCFGATVNNVSNDPAAHVAVQKSSNYNNGPSVQQILPEAIWAPATGGGTWTTEVQMMDVTGGTEVSVNFYCGGVRRGPFVLWRGSGALMKVVKYSNLLQTIDILDTGEFSYYGKVGAVEFQTQDGMIRVTARTLNGNYSKTFPGLNLVNAETADTTRTMLIQNYTNNAGYRSTSGFFNPTGDSVTVELTLLDGNGTQIGSQFSKTLVGYDFQAFNPFTQAGVPYPANSYDNVILRIRPTSGAGKVMCFGASVDNTSNDPASHLAVQGE